MYKFCIDIVAALDYADFMYFPLGHRESPAVAGAEPGSKRGTTT